MKKKQVSCPRLLWSRGKMVYNGTGFRWASLLRRGEEVGIFQRRDLRAFVRNFVSNHQGGLGRLLLRAFSAFFVDGFGTPQHSLLKPSNAELTRD